MVKNTQVTVRSHSEEREWLLSLGDGNIVEGVRHLIRQSRENEAANSDSNRDNRQPLKR
ncbi:MAG: hypothetical protein U0401_01960 [Anaerolineae bacterium]